MRVWITNVDRRFTFSTVNPVWAACINGGFVPEKIILITDKRLSARARTITEWLTNIVASYGKPPVIEAVVFDEEDMNAYSDSLVSLLKKELENEVAIDITPGRKFMSALMLSWGMRLKVPRIFYLHLTDYSFAELPFVAIPFSCQKLRNIRDIMGDK